MTKPRAGPPVPTNDRWPPEEIARLAATSGKPLEVTCAVAFLRSQWEAWLGPHFDDGGQPRELDVLAEKTTVDETPTHKLGIMSTTRLLVSCKGFPKERSPLVYSASPASMTALGPSLVASQIAVPGWWPDSRPHLSDIEARAARHLLGTLGLRDNRQAVGFDVIERSEYPQKSNLPPRIEYKRATDGDRTIYSAMNSALKATLFWNQHIPNSSTHDTQPTIILHVPVCILSVPMWDVSIDGGRVAEPKMQSFAFQTTFYPAGGEERQPTTILADQAKLDVLITALDSLHNWLRQEIRARLSASARTEKR